VLHTFELFTNNSIVFYCCLNIILVHDFVSDEDKIAAILCHFYNCHIANCAKYQNNCAQIKPLKINVHQMRCVSHAVAFVPPGSNATVFYCVWLIAEISSIAMVHCCW